MRTGPVRARGTPPGTATKFAEPPPRAPRPKNYPPFTNMSLDAARQHGNPNGPPLSNVVNGFFTIAVEILRPSRLRARWKRFGRPRLARSAIFRDRIEHELRRRSPPPRPHPSGSSDLRRPGARARGAGAVRAAMRPAPALDRRGRGPDRAGGCRPYPERGGTGGRRVADRLARRDPRGGPRRRPGGRDPGAARRQAREGDRRDAGGARRALAQRRRLSCGFKARQARRLALRSGPAQACAPGAGPAAPSYETFR